MVSMAINLTQSLRGFVVSVTDISTLLPRLVLERTFDLYWDTFIQPDVDRLDLHHQHAYSLN